MELAVTKGQGLELRVCMRCGFVHEQLNPAARKLLNQPKHQAEDACPRCHIMAMKPLNVLPDFSKGKVQPEAASVGAEELPDE